MLNPLTDTFVRDRLEKKYGPRRPTRIRAPNASHRVRFVSSRRSFPERSPYTPRPRPLDERRKRLLSMYTSADVQELRHDTHVPECLRVLFPKDSKDLVALLLSKVINETSGLSSAKCPRLVMHMCANEHIAREWMDCFSD